MQISAREFLKQAGMDEPMLPGMIKYKHHVGEKPGSSYTVVYDWKTNPEKIRVEVRPGLTGGMPDKRDISKYAVWLQTQNFMELDLGTATKN